ncbi:MAG: Gfo/Idh/MocA family oxidoreductase [bacterium]|nr:Gfo/Idh/MocA family oxidoreductase [bacterium]
MSAKINVLIIGAGHYAAGTTGRKRATDKDFGVLLPAVFELRRQGMVDKIFLAARDGDKISHLQSKLTVLAQEYGWDIHAQFFPGKGQVDEKAYRKALAVLPKPGAVLIATPDVLHKEMMLAAIEYGHHFMVVKPAVTKVKDVKEIIIKLKKKKLVGMVDYHKVYDDANLIIKDQYQKGVYGDIQHVYTQITQRRDMLEIFKWLSKENNVNHYLNSHYIHLVHFITKAKPVRVRAMAQFGVARDQYRVHTADLIQTQVEWKSSGGKSFVSYHLAGWSDPSETPAMTYQEIHIIGTKGRTDSDQRNRGFENIFVDTGNAIVNPYFFYLHKGVDGKIDLAGKYGFKSIKTFFETVQKVIDGQNPSEFDTMMPTVRGSLIVTKILEAADKSLKNDSKIIRM